MTTVKQLNLSIGDNTGKVKERYWQAFLIAFIISFVFLLPYLIMDSGIFFYYGDYNVQQIPFYMHAHEAIRSGNIGWDWLTDLGSNFVGSYSFYLLGSPFFWLTLPFPTAVLPYLMAPLLCLKFGVAALTSYAFIRRFTKTTEFALMGSLLYAFSSFMIYNIFFNHFHEVVAFFPLLLIAMEEAIVNNRKGYFALAVGLCAFVNYYFFFGQVVFVVIYFIIRTECSDFPVNMKKFLWLGLEAVIGLVLSMGLLLPSLMAIMSNGRTSSFISGWNMLFYSDEQRYGLILQSLFFPADIPARPNFFPDSNAKWSSVAAYLPMFSMAGVITFLKDKANHWASRLLKVCLVMALIPFLNSAFSAFNYSYYARWFYMPILIMAMITARVFENKHSSVDHGLKWTLLITLAFSLIGILPAYKNGEYVFGELPTYQDRFWVNVAISIVGILFVSILVVYFRNRRKKFIQLSLVGISLITLAYALTSISWGKSASYTTYQLTDLGLNYADTLDLPDEEGEFYRIDVYEGMDNWPMYWGKSTIQAFHSVVPASIVDFYEEIGVDRVVASRPDQKYKGLRSLTSVKYLFMEPNKKGADTTGYTLYQEENNMQIYTNDNYIPMGFTYENYIDQAMLDSVEESNRDRMLVKAILLDDEQIKKFSDILNPLDSSSTSQLTAEDLRKDAQARNLQTADSFTTNSEGFVATTSFANDELLFFSVPYDDGWTATVNGETVDIERVNAGFMAVRVPAGSAEIRFEYTTPGLQTGIICSIIALLAVIAIFVCSRKLSKKYPAMFCKQAGKHRELLEEFDEYEILDDIDAENNVLETDETNVPLMITPKDTEDRFQSNSMYDIQQDGDEIIKVDEQENEY